MPETWSLLFFSKRQNLLPDNTFARYGCFVVSNLPHTPVFLYSPEENMGSSIPIFITDTNSQITHYISHTYDTKG